MPLSFPAGFRPGSARGHADLIAFERGTQ